MRRRPGAFTLALCVASAVTVLTSAGTAHAQTGKATAVNVGVGSKVTVDYPGFPAPNEGAFVKTNVNARNKQQTSQGFETPQQCDVDPEPCLDIPINLSVPEAVRLHHTLALSITVSYTDPVFVGTPAGSQEGQVLRVYLWKEHPDNDKFGHPVFVAYDYANNPGYATAYQIPTRHFFVVVIPTRTLNIPFKIVYSFQDIDAEGFVPTAPPSGITPPSTTGSSSGAPAAFNNPGAIGSPNAPIGGALTPRLGNGAAPIVVPNIAGGRLNATLLAATEVSLPNTLGKAGSADITGSRSTIGTDVKGSSSAHTVIELLILPLLVLFLTLLLSGRRRKQEHSTSISVASD